jgi:hypothetical protein
VRVDGTVPQRGARIPPQPPRAHSAPASEAPATWRRPREPGRALRDSGLITTEEYEAKKRELLERL